MQFAVTEAALACRITLEMLILDADLSVYSIPIATAGRLASISAVSILALEHVDREPGVMSSTTSPPALVLKARVEIHLSTADTTSQLVRKN